MKKLSLSLFIAFCSTTSFSQTISTIAGTGISGYSGDGGAATTALLYNPAHIAIDCSGNIYFTDQSNNVVRKIDVSGNISTIAGTGLASYGGDGGPATAAYLHGPSYVILDKNNDVVISDAGNSVIRRIDPSGNIHTIAGTTYGYSGDGGPASAAQLKNATCIVYDAHNNLYIADYGGARLRKIDTSGIITTVTGNGTGGFSGDGGPATAAVINLPAAIVFDAIGNLYFCDQNNDRIRKIDTFGTITTFAGTGTFGFAGDGGPATAAHFTYPSDMKIDNYGNMWIVDAYNNAVRKIDTAGIITTVAGTSSSGYTGDGGAATAATLHQPWGLDLDDCGNLYIADAENNVIRKVIYNMMTPITGPSSVSTETSITLSDLSGCGIWSSGTAGIATVNPSTGLVNGVSAGSVTISYTNYCGTSEYTVTVNAYSENVAQNATTQNAKFSIVPNPNNGVFMLTGNIMSSSANSSSLKIQIIDVLGKVIYSDDATFVNGVFNKKISLNNNIVSGIYLIQLKNDELNQVIRFTVNR